MRQIISFCTLLFALAIFTLPVLAGGKDYHDQSLKGKDFTKDDLKGANFSDAVLRDCDFSRGNLPGANFKGADISAQFFGANAKGADFREAKMTGFTGDAADFSKANFEGVDLNNSHFLNDNFREANLQKTKGWTNVSMCDFSKADLRGANLRGMTWTNEQQIPRFRGAIYDEDTAWPEGFDPKAAGAILKAPDSDKKKIAFQEASINSITLNTMAALLPIPQIIFFLAMMFLPAGTNKFSVSIEGTQVTWTHQADGWHAERAGRDGGVWSVKGSDVTGLGSKTNVGGFVHVADGSEGKKTVTLKGKAVTATLTATTLTIEQGEGGALGKPVVITYSTEDSEKLPPAEK